MCEAHSCVKENDTGLEVLCTSQTPFASVCWSHLLSDSSGGPALTGTLKIRSFCPQNVCDSCSGGGMSQPVK